MTNGTDYVDGPVIAVSVGSTYVYQTVDLSAVPGVADNLDFAFRIVTEFESTATGSGTTGYVAIATNYGTSGTIRYDQVSIFALPLPLEISGTVELEGFAGLARNGTGQRAVTFVVTDIATNQLAPVTLTLNFTNGAVGYVLTNLPATPSLLSAKTT